VVVRCVDLEVIKSIEDILKQEYELVGNYADYKIYAQKNNRVLYDPELKKVVLTYEVVKE
jgi:hypothetical protein